MSTSGGDGRNIDPRIGALAGEASDQEVPRGRADAEGSPPFDVWTRTPGQDGASDEPSYYDRPAVKEPTWIWTVPTYFVVGGAAGSAAVLGAAAQLVDRRGLGRLVARCRWIAAAGGALGTALLIADLGRPERFLHMLRVFRPSSPMNLGSWVLSTIAPVATGSAILAGTDGFLGLVGDVAGLNSGLAGLPLTGYTAVLLGSTAIPVWQQTRRTTPPLFVASGAAAGASLLQLFELSNREERIIRMFALAGAFGELVAHAAMERQAGRVERVAEPLHEGLAGSLLRAAKACAAASLPLTILGRRRRWVRVLAGLTGALGAGATKFGVFHAGKASAREPRPTFEMQRAGRAASGLRTRPASDGVAS
jgi:Polysulphide reductase, NrfD